VGSDEGLGGGGRGPDEGLGVGGRGLGNDARIADPTGPNPKSQIQNPKSAGPKSKIQNPKSAIARAAGGLLVTAAMLVAITPWTIYNYQAYGRLIFLDTANVTAFWHYNNYRGENETARIEALPNPADRQALILREGLANILGYPDRFLRNVANSLGYTWHLELQSAIQPNAWDLTQRDADVPEVLPGDALFLFVALAGLAGLAGLGGRGGWRPADQAGRVRRVLVFWIVCMGLLGAIIPYDARYRMPAAPALIIFAAGLLASADWRRVGDPRHWGRILRARPGVALLSAALGAWVIAGALGPRIPAAIQALTLAWQADHTDDPQSADRLNQAAIAALPSSFWPYRHAADSARQRGQDSAARRLYASARPRGEDPRDILGFADLVYRHPEWRLTPDEQHWLAADANGLRGWPWNSFAATPQTQLTLGGDRDWSYIQGFQGTERTAGMTFRWSTGVGQVRLPAPGAGPPATAVRLRLAAPAIGPPGAWPVTIQVAGAAPTHLDVIPGWADYTVRLEPAVRGAIDLEIISPLRNPRTYDPAARDNRRLGVGLAAVERLAAGP
ncbi:MAG TPA: hypothetical protein VKY74_08515, partial [Chloroflexia bacterium]|nr:hypothetical protein [Chloroflexia bacterium]